MFDLTRGEVAMIVFLFALVWGAGWVPRVGERLGERFAGRPRSRRDGG